MESMELTPSERDLLQLLQKRYEMKKRREEQKVSDRQLLLNSVKAIHSDEITTSSKEKFKAIDSMPIVATSANSLNTTTTGIKLPTPFEKISNPISSSSTKETKIEHISHQHVIADPTIVESTSSDTISTQSPSNNTQQTIKRKKVVDDELDAEEDTYKAYVQDDFDNVSNLNVILSNSWRTTNSSTNLKLLLDNFGFHDNLYNVLVLRIIIPTAQAHWSISISPTDDMDNQDIFLQIAQRYRQKKDIIDMSLNDKIYSWGNADKRQWKPTSRSTMLLAVIIRQEAFYIFFDDKLQFSFPHRRDISLLNKLSLVVPIVDDNMKSEDLIVQRVWWGSYNNNILQKLLIPPESIEKNAFQYKENLNNLKIRNNNPFYLTLVVNGLPPLINESDLLDVETLILQMLKQQGLECKTMNIIRNKRCAYLRMETEDDVSKAVSNLNNIVIGTDSDKFEFQWAKLLQ